MIKVNIIGCDDWMFEIETICPICGKKHTISVNRFEFSDGIQRYRYQGVLIQDAFPRFTPSQREFLLTGICDSCLDKMWKTTDILTISWYIGHVANLIFQIKNNHFWLDIRNKNILSTILQTRLINGIIHSS